MKNKLYRFNFKASWNGGKALVKATSQESAWKALKKIYPQLESLKKCVVIEIADRAGVLFFDDGDY